MFVTLFKRDSGTYFFIRILRKLLRTPFLQNTSSDCFFVCDKSIQTHYFEEKSDQTNTEQQMNFPWVFSSFCFEPIEHICANIYLSKVNNSHIRKSCEICSKLTIKTQERSFVVLVPLLLTLNKFHTFF